MTPVRQYTDEIHHALGYWATWLPGTRLQLGECGTVDGRVFNGEGALSDFGISFTVSRGTEPSSIQYASGDGVEYTLQAEADNQKIPQIPQGRAGLKIAFSRESAVVFIASEVYEERIANVHELSTTLMDRITMGEFPRNYAVVTHLVSAASATILISSGDKAEFVVSAEADLKAGLLELANLGASMSRVSSQQLATEIVAEQGLTPLFKIVGLKRNGRFGLGDKTVGALKFEEGDVVEFDEIDPREVDLD